MSKSKNIKDTTKSATTKSAPKNNEIKTESKKINEIKGKTTYYSSNNILKNVIIAVLVLVALFFVTKIVESFSKSSTKPSSAEINIDTNKINEIVANWVEGNPKLILESVMKMQQNEGKNRAMEAEKLYKNVSIRKNDIFNKKSDPSNQALEYDITIVEFFDYNCGFCKRATKTIEKLTIEDKKVRVIFKELPILGESSEILAKASIAFNKVSPKKYFDFHRELMTSNARNTDDVARVAKKHGVSESELKKALSKYNKEILAEIEFNRELSKSIGINGTPAFIIGETILPGAVPLNTLKNEIKKERAK